MNCKNIQKNISRYLDAELSQSETKAFTEHLKKCSACHAEVKAFELILSEASSFEEVTAPDTLWSRIDNELNVIPSNSLHRTTPTDGGFVVNWFKKVIQIPGPAIQIAGIAAILVIGIFLGRYFFPASSDDLAWQGTEISASEAQLISSRTEHYLEKSKILFLGIVNAESDSEQNSSWNTEKRVARNLVTEAAYLKGGLSKMKNERLKLLVEELELILLEIANLEEQHDVNNIELIKSGIDRRGLLLKIHLQDLTTTRSSGKPNPMKNSL